MSIVKRSFLSNLFGDVYDFLNDDIGKFIIAIGSFLILIAGTLSYFFYWKFISVILDYITGTSLLFLAYIITLIITLDFQVEQDIPERHCETLEENKYYSRKYKWTIVWGIFLIILGIAAIFFSNKYRKHYSFQCETFRVDEAKGVYHIFKCNDSKNATKITLMKGYDVEKNEYLLCPACEEWAEDAEGEFLMNHKYSLK